MKTRPISTISNFLAQLKNEPNRGKLENDIYGTLGFSIGTIPCRLHDLMMVSSQLQKV